MPTNRELSLRNCSVHPPGLQKLDRPRVAHGQTAPLNSASDRGCSAPIFGRFHAETKNPEFLDFVEGDFAGPAINYERGLRGRVRRLATNAFGKSGGMKSGRGGQALLGGLLSCGRCGRTMSVVYPGRRPNPVYRCDRRQLQHGLGRCQILVAGAWTPPSPRRSFVLPPRYYAACQQANATWTPTGCISTI